VIGWSLKAWGRRRRSETSAGFSSEGRARTIPAEVVGFRDYKILLMPLGDSRGIQPGDPIFPMGVPAQAQVGRGLLGRVLDGMGTPIDNAGRWGKEKNTPSTLADRPGFSAENHRTGRCGGEGDQRLLAIGKGQRMAVFSGSGVGKSTLLGMMARHTTAEVNVVALIGERGREVREFIEKDLGQEGLKKSVVVVATSDQHPSCGCGRLLSHGHRRVFSRPESERPHDDGLHNRFAMAAREVGLAIGEPPASKGYTPSVFCQLPKLLERVGTSSGQGSITVFTRSWWRGTI